jgi:peptidoglycan/LPS O-acetylase OafA/YrhL
MSTVEYRRDIDGIRAIAVVSVVLYHFFPLFAPGGFVGVDIFFVISGYLITGNLIADADTGRFSFLSFYARRIRRILPALIIVLTSTLLIGWCMMLPDEFSLLGEHVLGGATFISNMILRRETGYFAPASELKPLLHLWSLGIEEQYYIIWPLVLFVVLLFNAGLIKVVLFILFVSFSYSVVHLPRSPEGTFFLPSTRIWELLIGSCIAAVNRASISDAPKAWGAVKGWISPDLQATIGLAAIASSIALFQSSDPYPGWRALIPTTGSALLITAGPTAWINRTVLAASVLVAIGLISYPLYLWHWPILAFLRLRLIVDLTRWETRLALVLLATLLAFLTWLFVERPIRFGWVPRRASALALVGLCSLTGIAGYAVKRGWIAPYISGPDVAEIIQAANEWAYPGAMSEIRVHGMPVRRMSGSRGAVLFVGDSNMEQYGPRIEALLTQSPQSYKSALFVTSGGCAPIPGVVEPLHPQCTGLMDTAFAVADENNVDTVVLAAEWWGYFSLPSYRIGGESLGNDAGRRLALRSLGEAIQRFEGAHRKVVLVLNIPMSGLLSPRGELDVGFLSVVRHSDRAVWRQQLLVSYGSLNEQITAVAGEAGASIVDPLDALCNVDGRCPADEQDGRPMYKDGDHLRPSFVRQHIHFFDEIMKNQGA